MFTQIDFLESEVGCATNLAFRNLNLASLLKLNFAQISFLESEIGNTCTFQPFEEGKFALRLKPCYRNPLSRMGSFFENMHILTSFLLFQHFKIAFSQSSQNEAFNCSLSCMK